MKRQVMKLNDGGVNLVVVRTDNAEVGKYRVYKRWYEPGPFGLMQRKRQIARCDSMSESLAVVERLVGFSVSGK